MVASFATRTVANFRLPRLIDDSKRARPRIRGTRRLPVRNLLVHFPARGRRYPSSREGPREVSAREVRLRSSPRRARVELQVARPADARARAGDRPTEARKARGKHNASDANIHHEHVRAQGGDEGASPALRFVQRPQEEGSGAIVSGAPREIPVRSTFARGDESTPTAICLPPSRKKGSGKPTSAFSARSTRL